MDNPFFAIAAGSGRMHLYPNVTELLASKPGVTTEPLEFFDVHGFRLLPVLDDQWRLADLRRAGSPSEDAVRDRLASAVKQLWTDAGGRTDNPAPLPTPPEFEQRLSLPECYGLLTELGFGHGAPQRPPAFAHTDRRGPWHNFWSH